MGYVGGFLGDEELKFGDGSSEDPGSFKIILLFIITTMPAIYKHKILVQYSGTYGRIEEDGNLLYTLPAIIVVVY